MKLDIAVVGAGISGITAAYHTQDQHDVTLYEKNDYIGGHTNTAVIPQGPDAGTPVDTGFIVLNYATYPNFIKFLDKLGVPISKSDMSFSYYCQTSGLFYATRSLNALFARRRNLINPGHYLFLKEIVRFIRKTRTDYQEDRLGEMTLGQFLSRSNFGQAVTRQFVLPMAAAIWSSPDAAMMDFPMATFAQFYDNHGLLSLRNHPPWYFVRGGSHTYVKAFLAQFKGKAISGQPVKQIRRREKDVVLTFMDGKEAVHDRVIIATHADEALALLADASSEETALLSAWDYAENSTCLHTDPALMPPHKRAWASWNYIHHKKGTTRSPITLSYHMNRLQKLDTARDYFVTLNPPDGIPESKIIGSFSYTHPIFTPKSFDMQKKVALLNGQRQTCFCGSHFGFGFHEDGVKSGIQAAGAVEVEP